MSFLKPQVPDHVTYPPVDGYVIAIRKTSSYETPYTKHYVKDPQKDSHVIHDIHEHYPYEIKMAAFNAFGEGKFTRCVVVGKYINDIQYEFTYIAILKTHNWYEYASNMVN